VNASEYKARKRRPSIVYNPAFGLPIWGPPTLRWIENASDGLRVHAKREDRNGREPTGWYCDHCCDSVTSATVLQLPAARDGTRRFMAACTDPYNHDLYLTDCDFTYDLRQAWDWAERLAEDYAEFCQEENAKFQAEQQIECARESICGLREQHTRTIEELRRLRDTIEFDAPLLTNAARQHLRSLRKEVSDAVELVRKLRDNPTYAVHG
jgi:hypothetical protein